MKNTIQNILYMPIAFLPMLRVLCLRGFDISLSGTGQSTSEVAETTT